MPKWESTAKKEVLTEPVGTYRYPMAKAMLRPDVGVQSQFRKKKPPQRYRYDSSLSPSLDWDNGDSTRELGEWLIHCIEQAS
jgi:adenine-specific DNA-methyltransferase